MAELAPKEQLQPCLLDRLTDEHPQATRESWHERVVSPSQFRKAVIRDLDMLLNSRSRPFHWFQDPLYDFELAQASVLNYGIPEVYGITASGVNPRELETLIRKAVEAYEPRIAPASLMVRVIPPENPQAIRALVVEIAGDLWGHPAPDHILHRMEVDLDSGHCEPSSARGGKGIG
jgi:type VI secretion system protein ImpF